GELAAAQECQCAVGVAAADGGGEGSHVEGGALAVAAGEVDVADGEGGGMGSWSESTPTRAFGATSPASGGGVGCGARIGCSGEDAGQDVACFHRRQLVRVAEEDQAGAVGDGFD